MYFASMILNFSLVWKTYLLFFPQLKKKIFLEKRIEDPNISACLL